MTPFIAQIQPFAFNFAPRGWVLCNGQILAISQYTAVFALVGTTFGGDGRTSFGVPDLRGRSMVGVGTGPGLINRAWGQRGGANFVNLTTSQLPSHSHVAQLKGRKEPGGSFNPRGNVLAADTAAAIYSPSAADTDMGSSSIVVGNTGSSTEVFIDSPYLGIYIGFALTGIFPSRN